MSWKIAALYILASSVAAFGAPKIADQRYIYRIVTSLPDGTVRISAGFRLEGERGIITALHAVLNGNIAADPATGQSFHDLRIVEADVSHDVAKLSSEELDSEPLEGLERGDSETLESGAILVVGGYPEAVVDINMKQLVVGIPSTEELVSLVPGNKRAMIADRKSPEDDIHVVHLASTTVPGDSGAPIWDQDGKVVCIGNGGIPGADISWAIPIETIKWASADEIAKDLHTLAARHDDGLFSVQLDVPQNPKALIAYAVSAAEELEKFVNADPAQFRRLVLQPPQFVKLYFHVIQDLPQHPNDPSVLKQYYGQKANLGSYSPGLPYVFQYISKVQKLRQQVEALSKVDSLGSSQQMLLESEAGQIERHEENQVLVSSVITNPEPNAVEAKRGLFDETFIDVPVNVLGTTIQNLKQLESAE
jgi:hypothetical protein